MIIIKIPSRLLELVSLSEVAHEIVLPGEGGVAHRTRHLEPDMYPEVSVETARD